MKKTMFVLLSVLCFGLNAAEKQGHVHVHDHDHHEHDHGHEQEDHGHVKHEDHGHEHEHDHNHDHDHAHEHNHDRDRAHEHVHDHDHGHGKSVEVAEAIQKVMGLKTVHPEKRRLHSTVTLTGRYELAPDARRTVATPVAGHLTVLVKPLARVKKGDALFTVEAPELSSRAREIAVLEKRLAVYKDIGTKNAQLESDLAVKKVEREALIGGAEEKDGVVTVRAVSDGMVEAFPSDSGAWVETGAAVVRLVNPGAIRLKALAAASDVTRLGDGLKATVDGVEGTIRIGVGDESGLVPVYVIFPKGAAKGRSGARATVACVTDEHEAPVTAIPSRCIVRIGLRPTVFVKDEHDKDRFLAVDVVPGLSDGGWTAVTGLPDDDDLEVVSEGAYELRLALPSGDSKPAGHFHADGTFHEGKD